MIILFTIALDVFRISRDFWARIFRGHRETSVSFDKKRGEQTWAHATPATVNVEENNGKRENDYTFFVSFQVAITSHLIIFFLILEFHKSDNAGFITKTCLYNFDPLNPTFI